MGSNTSLIATVSPRYTIRQARGGPADACNPAGTGVRLKGIQFKRNVSKVKKTVLLVSVAAVALGGIAISIAQSTAPQAHSGSAERGLIGVALYDTGAKIVGMYGSPDQVLALSIGGGGATGGAGGGGGTGGAGTQGGQRGGPGVGGAPEPNLDNQTFPGGLIGNPFGDGSEWRQNLPAPISAGGTQSAGDSGGDSGRGSGAAAGGGSRGGGGGAVGGGSTQKVIFTRWVYKRNNSKYAFVLDKFNRVIQIEAVGLSNKSVKTRRGISFGSSFGTVIKAYNAPDGYEISGDNIVMRYLVRDRVAFKLSRIKADKPHVVTGVVVAAGKT